ncbi:MAG TPA: tetratricopeptide repeat protein [Candidatus Eisenbacteria bacterium]
MTRVPALILLAAAVLAAPPALAPPARAMGEPPPRAAKAEPESASAVVSDSSALRTPGGGARATAEARYQTGWTFVEAAKRDLAGGRPEQARKKFGKARMHFGQATQLDPRYHQAWNMLGFCARQCGDLKLALEAYGKCLEIEPEYAEAHEYRGEAYLQAGEIEKAKAELAWLRSRRSVEADELAEKIARAEAGGADSTKAAGWWKARSADSTGAQRK